MRHLVSIADLTPDDVEGIYRTLEKVYDMPHPWMTAITFFAEPSTRTLMSFRFALVQLGIKEIPFNMAESSMLKGESLKDTFSTLSQYNPYYIIIRHEDGIACQVAEEVFNKTQTSIINAGTGKTNHPTQALGDYYTMQQLKQPPKQVAIVGDVVHSRVAASLCQLLPKVGISTAVCGPSGFVPSHGMGFDNVEVFTDLTPIKDADIVYVLRPQRERFKSDLLDIDEYKSNWQIRSVKETQWVMHAGPMNRGLEISSALADGPRSLIKFQEQDGFTVRQAVLRWVFHG